MTDDLVKRLRNNCSCNFESTPCGAEEECRNAFEAADRIETLEAALREIACDGEDCDCQAPQYCSYGIARLALGERKDG
jgi:hypothetical protein